MAGFSDEAENRILDHIFNDPVYTPATPLYLALTTSAVAESDTLTNAAAKEAGYTGYARKSVAAADMAAAAAGSKASGVTLTFAACTAGTSTIIGWFLCTAASGTTGDMVVFGTCTSTVISTTQTPPTVNSGGLAVTLD